MKVKVSSKFRSQIIRTVLSILVFILVYLLLFVLAVGLAVGCFYLSYYIITTHVNYITIFLVFGIAALGFLVVFFLLKFMFKITKTDRSYLIEIKRKDERELFKMIDDIVQKVKTSKPRKVYLSSEVNAAVFYDSSFWSMFLPIRKNLIIGLGLINTLTKEELKAVLSHEFGHFSQESMKLGSYVYSVNQVIHNLLFDNESFYKLAGSLMSVNIVGIFVSIAVKITEAIQWILRMMYSLVNKSYMSLSREMEFHADQIAAQVTGPQPLISALLRTELAEASLNSSMGFYETKIKDNQISTNLYPEQFYILNFLGKEHKLEVENELPKVTLNDINKFNKSKLVIENQWASHPTLEKRIEKLNSYDYKAEVEKGMANSIFNNIKKYQEKATKKIFDQVKYEGEKIVLPFEDFKAKYKEEFTENKFDDYYDGFYDNYNPQIFDLNKVDAIENVEIDKFLSDSNKNKSIKLINLKNDLETIIGIELKQIPVKTFDYDGVKYKRKNCAAVKTKIENKILQIQEELKEMDIKIYQYFIFKEKESQKKKKLTNLYQDFFSYEKNYQTMFDIYQELMNSSSFFQYQLSVEQINEYMISLTNAESKFISQLKILLEEEAYVELIPNNFREKFELYLSNDWQYFRNGKYQEKNIELFSETLNSFFYVLNLIYFKLKKDLLDYQVELLK